MAERSCSLELSQWFQSQSHRTWVRKPSRRFLREDHHVATAVTRQTLKCVEYVKQKLCATIEVGSEPWHLIAEGVLQQELHHHIWPVVSNDARKE